MIFRIVRSTFSFPECKSSFVRFKFNTAWKRYRCTLPFHSTPLLRFCRDFIRFWIVNTLLNSPCGVIRYRRSSTGISLFIRFSFTRTLDSHFPVCACLLRLALISSRSKPLSNSHVPCALCCFRAAFRALSRSMRRCICSLLVIIYAYPVRISMPVLTGYRLTDETKPGIIALP